MQNVLAADSLRVPATMRNRFTSAEAERFHYQHMRANPHHHRSSCWCCCRTCGFNALRVLENDVAASARGR